MSIPDSNLAMAIVGISAELPSGSYSKKNLDHHSFFDFLLNKRQSYEPIPRDRFDLERWHGIGLGHTISEKGSFLKDVPLFDHVEFGITAKDAKNMSLSTRKLIEHSFLALLDSGTLYRGKNVGCYMSGTAFDIQGVTEPDELEATGSFAGYPYMIANKVSYHLDLRGPSVPVDTACSSSMTALHLAIQAIQAGDCESAIVGGCQLNFRLVDFIQYSQGSVLSSDGTCKPLDESANGFSRGEGVAVIALKPLEHAIRDNDYIYATILKTGINSSGNLAPVSAPVASAQEEAMKRAFNDINRSPKEVDYIELHATGTAAGDPAEANWVGDAFGQRESELLVGSVKGNIGHLEICAFLASLLKVCAMFQHRLLPPTVNLTVPNPAIEWNRWKMRAPTEVTSIARDHQLLASITSSGIGGSNGHAILESFHDPLHCTSHSYSNGWPLLILCGGLSPRTAFEISKFVQTRWTTLDVKDLDQYASACSRRGRQMPWQTFSIMLNNIVLTPFTQPLLLPKSTPRIAYVFSGQGPQYIQMGTRLFQTFPIFRESILKMDTVYEMATGHSIRSLGLFCAGAIDKWDIWPISVTLPAIAMVQMAMYDLLSSIGITPDVVVGHSAGETAMMYASGACSREMALQIAIARGIALATLEDLGGSMVALSCGPDMAKSIIDDVMKDRTGILQIACYNSDSAVTLAGAESLLEISIALAKSRDISAHKLRTKIAVHSEFVNKCKTIYFQKIEVIFSRHPGDHKPSIATYSSTFGTLLDIFTPEYFWHNARKPVKFSQAIKSIVNDHPNIAFLEISPHPVLSTYITDNGVAGGHVISFMRRTKDPQSFSEPHLFLQGVAKLSLIGYTGIDFHSLNNTRPSASQEVPFYPFARKHIPFRPEPAKSTLSARESQWSGPLLHTGLRLNAFTHPKLAEHVIMGEPILPAAGFIEMLFEAGIKLAWNVRFLFMLPLTRGRLLPVQFDVNGASWSVSSELQRDPVKMRVHAAGFMTTNTAPLEAGALSILDMKQRLQQIDISNFYQTLAHFAQYGPVYQRVTACWKLDDEALVKIRAHDDDLSDMNKYVMHPALLDACLHVMVHPMFTANADRSVYYLPTSVETVALYDATFIRTTLPKDIYCHVRYRSWDPTGINFDLSVIDSHGTILCQLLGFRIAQHGKTGDVSPLSEYQSIYEGRHEIVYQPLLVSTHYTSVGDETIEIASLDNAASREFSTLMTAHSFIQINGGHSLRDILDFICVSGGKKVIRLLSIGAELLEKVDAVTETDVNPNFMLEIHVLAERKPVPQSSMAARRIAKISSTLSEDGPVTTFYDVIICQSSDVGGTLLHVLPALLPCGFVLVSSREEDIQDTSENSNTYSSTVSHTIWRKENHDPASLRVKIATSSAGQEFLRPHLSQPCTADSDTPFERPTSIVTFQSDNVLALRQRIQQLKDNEKLWIQASQDIQGYAALGFVRSLRKEIVAKDICLALFDNKWSEEERFEMISSFSSCAYIEKEVIVDSFGTLRVPRIIPASMAESNIIPFHLTTIHHEPQSTATVQHITNPIIQLLPHHVLVHISASSLEYGGLRAIVGHIDADSGSNTWKQNANVIGITSLPIPNNSYPVMFHEESLAPLTDLESSAPSAIAQATMAIFIVALAIGSKVLTQHASLKGLRVLITQNTSDDDIGQCLADLMTLLNVTVVTTLKVITPNILSEIRSCNVGFTGWTNPSDIEVITSMLPDSASLWCWNSPRSDLLLSNQWVAGSILRDTQDLLCNFVQSRLKSDGRLSIPQIQKTISRHVDHLFEGSKEYFLIGGLGSLGIRLALWMYEHGARNIVLTSRRGTSSSLTEYKDEMACRVLAYLQRQQDLRLRLEACDAGSDLAMDHLFQNVNRPIGGCILMSVVLSDRLFISHDHSSYSTPFPAKVGAVIALENAIRIPALDFLVSISSAATLGNVGQTNYSSANTAVDGLLSKYRNAFSLIAPAIVDSITISHGIDLLPDQRFREWLPWSMTCSELFQCLGDGIRSIQQNKISVYIPRLNWYHLKQHLGSSPIYDHLVYEDTTILQEQPATSNELLHIIVTKDLDIDPADFSSDTPLTSYGLDSLSAGRLSHSLKPFLQISQLQLLADITLNQIEKRIQDNRDLSSESPIDGLVTEREFDWKLLNQPGQALVKLVKGKGVPLILIHGGNGAIVAFIALQERFTSPLWAIQNTPECPTNSLKDMAAFYFLQIKAAQPSGPYRIGAFCACSLLAIEIGYLLQNSGDRVAQLVMLDHCPPLYSSPIFPLDSDSIQTKQASHSLIAAAVRSMLDVYTREASLSRRKIGLEIERAFKGGATSEHIHNYIKFIRQFVTMVATFLIELCDIKTSEEIDFERMNHRLKEWTVGLDAPLTIVVAEKGMFKSVSEEWSDFNWAGESIAKVQVQGVGHFSLMESSELIQALENGWKQ